MPRSDLSSIILDWAHDSIRFVREVFSVEPTSQQKQALLAIQDMVWAKIRTSTFLRSGKAPVEGITDRDRDLAKKFGISVMSGVGTGKGAVAAWIVMWFLACFPFPKIACVGPSAHQLRDNVWAEISKWHNQCKIKDWFVWQSDKFYFKEHEGKQWFAVARTANTKNSPEEQAETLAGIHEEFVLIIADEASGIPDPVFRPLESTLTGKCNLAALFFNPTRGKGYAHDSQFKERDAWIPLRWNAEESDLVTRESIARLEKKYGRESNTFRIRVLGLPPVAGENLVIPWEWIVDAVEREVEPLDDDQLIYTLDVGAGGDDSVGLRRYGPKVHPLEAVSYPESEKLTDWAVRAILGCEPKAVFVDSVGVGWGIAGNLRVRLKNTGIDVVDVNVSQAAFNEERFFRLRDELWWRTREEFEKGIISIPDDALLMGDLNAPRYDESSGKVKIESKKDMKNRGLDSPNRADALIMTNMWGHDLVRQIYKQTKKKKTATTSSWKTV